MERIWIVFADIHGNYEALTSVIRDISVRFRSEHIEKYICLGDVVGYGPSPNECLEIVKNKADICIRGNHERAVLNTSLLRYFNEVAARAVLWTIEELSQENMEYIKTLKDESIIEGDHILAVHGSPRDPDEYILSIYSAKENLQLLLKKTITLAFYGHTHIPMLWLMTHENIYFQQIVVPEDKEELTIELPETKPLESTLMINPGSIGQPRDGDPRASYVAYYPQTHKIKFIRIPYDIDKVHKKILEKGLPSILGRRLYYGE